MAGRIVLGVANPSLDANGNPVNGATLTFYQNGTTTPQAIYSDLGLGTPLSNPLTSDSAGAFPEIYAPYGSAYSVKWSRAGQVDVTINDVYANSFPTLSTRQDLTSGSAATYTTPAGVRQLRIRLVGGGGGGGGSSTSGAGTGGTGGTTIFNSINAVGGSGGVGGISAGAPSGGAGGTGGTGGTSPTTIRHPGTGGSGGVNLGTSGADAVGGAGGSSMLGGGAKGNGSTSAGVANSGGGGSGGLIGTSGASGAGGGGGEGVEITINNPSATYTYTVGAAGTAGTAGTGGNAGAAGGTGRIIVDEIY